MVEVIRVDKLRGLMAEKGFTGVDMASKLNITPKTFYDKMSKGVFGSDEMEIMINVLDISDPVSIFFASEVT